MKIRIGSIVVAAALFGSLAVADQPKDQASPPQNAQGMQMPSRADVMRDIQNTFGFVPQFFQSIAPDALPGFWMSMKGLEISTTTKLDMKTKELIGLAVASQIPCDYCTQFHTEGARKSGASEQEIQEAVAMAAMTRMGSTLLNGMQVDKAQFRRDLDRVKTNRAAHR